MAQGLFRKEALEARRTQWLGTILLAQPLRLWALALGAALAATAVLLFLTLGSYTRRSRVIGQLVPTRGIATVLAPATGVISRLDVAEGARVTAGQSLAVLSIPRATVSGGDTLAALEDNLQLRRTSLEYAEVAERQQLSAQAAGLASQLMTARGELAQLEAEISTRKAQIHIAGETLARLRKLQGSLYVSEIQIDQQESAALELVGGMQALQRQAIISRRGIVQLQQALRELPARRQAVDASFQRDRATLAQEQVETQARGALAVAAPVEGIVATQIVKPGQAVVAGQPLLSVLPGDGRLEAELLVPSRAIGFIEPGDAVLLRYQAYPFQKFGHHRGKVVRISRSALNSSELHSLIGNPQAGEPLYRVTVALSRQAITAYGKPEALKPGMLLEADVLGEKRQLIEWVFEPLYSLQGKING